ncbi:MAG: ATP-binding protein [Gammaproteobacteria bacterium]|nr:ATP-binding protein [Gammaproteobacteria bacterium]MDH5652946.1 ATP-binding protein [Gammaproteobacteria bacterium]
MSQSGANYPAALEQAFQTFNQLSGQLAESYQALENRVAQLNSELANTQDERIKELTAKEKLASRLEALLSALPGGVVVLDQFGRVQEHNPVAINLLGEPLHGEVWADVIRRAFAPRNDDGHDMSLSDGRRVNISTCPLGTEPGQILLITDVSEMRKLQDRLSQHQRLAAMGEMAASLAHQIRTPLSSAILYSSNLKRGTLTQEQHRQTSEKILQRLRHLEHIVNDMLLYARGGGSSGGEQFGVSDLLTELENTVEQQLTISHSKLRINDMTQNIVVAGNRQMLLSAMINLIVNAIQAGGQGVEITISAGCDGHNLQLLISDNGPGFTEEGRERAFHPFFTTRSDGTGLGLAVVAAIVNAHKGEITLESTIGKGSTFIMQLPIITQPQADISHAQVYISSGTYA